MKQLVKIWGNISIYVCNLYSTHNSRQYIFHYQYGLTISDGFLDVYLGLVDSYKNQSRELFR
jgi:hypothetical protein